MNSQRGVALILALLATSFLSAVGLGLAVMVFMDRLATGNVRGSVALLHAADAGIELAAHDLARADWNAALAGVAQATLRGRLDDRRAGHSWRRRREPGGGNQRNQLRQGLNLHRRPNDRQHGRAALGRQQPALAVVCVRSPRKHHRGGAPDAVLPGGVDCRRCSRAGWRSLARWRGARARRSAGSGRCVWAVGFARRHRSRVGARLFR